MPRKNEVAMQLVSMVPRHGTVQDSVQEKGCEEGSKAYGTKSRMLQMIGNDHPGPLRFKWRSSSGFDAINLAIASMSCHRPLPQASVESS